jgi:integrase
MPRQPGIWFWKTRNAWYTQIKGKKVRLHEDKRQAHLELHRLLSSEGRLDARQKDQLTFADAVEAYLAGYQHHRPSTVRNAHDKLADLCVGFGSRRLASLQPHEVLAWIAKWPGRSGRLGEPTRALLWRWCRQLYKWCRDTGWLDIDPFARATCPWKIRRRKEVMSEREYELIMGLPRLSAQFKEVVEFVWRTGIRPGELAVLSAAHMDHSLRCLRFEPDEHKTGGKTGEPREVFIPSDLWDRLNAYAKIRGKGPLLRKANGKPWSQPSISRVFNKIKVRHKLKCVLYQARHRYATAMLEGGVDRNKVAVLMGHDDPRTLSTYYHPEKEAMGAEVERVQGSAEAERLTQIRGEMEKKRLEAKERERKKDNERRKKNRAKLKGTEE